MTGGLRFTRDDKDFTRNFSLIPFSSNLIDIDSRKDNAWTPRVGVDFFLNERAIYDLYSGRFVEYRDGVTVVGQYRADDHCNDNDAAASIRSHNQRIRPDDALSFEVDRIGTW